MGRRRDAGYEPGGVRLAADPAARESEQLGHPPPTRFRRNPASSPGVSTRQAKSSAHSTPMAPDPAAHPEVEPLRTAIRRAGRLTAAFRMVLIVGLALLAVYAFDPYISLRLHLAYGEAIPTWCFGPPPIFSTPELVLLAIPDYSRGVLGCLLACAAALLYRQARVRHLRRRLAALPPAARQEVVATFRRADGDTRCIAAALELTARRATELLPATSPLARSTEISPS